MKSLPIAPAYGGTYTTKISMHRAAVLKGIRVRISLHVNTRPHHDWAPDMFMVKNVYGTERSLDNEVHKNLDRSVSTSHSMSFWREYAPTEDVLDVFLHRHMQLKTPSLKHPQFIASASRRRIFIYNSYQMLALI